MVFFGCFLIYILNDVNNGEHTHTHAHTRATAQLKLIDIGLMLSIQAKNRMTEKFIDRKVEIVENIQLFVFI